MPPRRGVKPRLNVNEVLARPAARSLFELLLRNEAPLRMRAAREELNLSISQFGLAIRALERHGLAQRRVLASTERITDPAPHPHVEATDQAREHGPALLLKIPVAGEAAVPVVDA